MIRRSSDTTLGYLLNLFGLFEIIFTNLFSSWTGIAYHYVAQGDRLTIVFFMIRLVVSLFKSWKLTLFSLKNPFRLFSHYLLLQYFVPLAWWLLVLIFVSFNFLIFFIRLMVIIMDFFKLRFLILDFLIKHWDLVLLWNRVESWWVPLGYVFNRACRGFECRRQRLHKI